MSDKHAVEFIRAGKEAEDTARLLAAKDREIGTLKSRLAIAEQRQKIAEHDLHELATQAELLAYLDDPTPLEYDHKPLKPSGQATAVIQCGDWHVEEIVRPSVINGLNEYTLAIADRRIKRMFENAVSLIESERGLSKIEDCVLALLGDFFTGHIHDELAETTSLPPTEAVDWVEDRIAGGIRFLLKHSGCKRITIPCCSGNHARITKKQRVSTEYGHSLEWLMYTHLARFFRNEPRVKWKVEKGYFNYLDIQGKLTRFSHGHWIRYQGGIMGIGVPVDKAIASWNATKHADFDCFQHWHQEGRGARWCLGNSLIGYNAFAMFVKAKCSPPTQTLLIFDRKRELPVLRREIFCT